MAWVAPHRWSLRTTLGLMTGAQVAMALVSWDRDFGCLLAVPTVGGGGMVAALKAKRHRTAYCLAAWAVGVAFYVAYSLPASALSHDFLMAWKYWPDFRSVAGMCMAAAAASLIFEPWMKRLSGRSLLLAAFGLAYGTLALFPLAWIVINVVFYPVLGPPATWPGTVDGGSMTLADFSRDALRAVPFSLLVASCSLHVGLPVGLAGAALLRWLLLVGTDLSPTDATVLKTVGTLQTAGRDPIRCFHVAGCVGCDALTAERRLERLLHLHRLSWSPRGGYRRLR